MEIKYAKALRSVSKIALLLCILSFLGLGIFFTYKSLKYKPYKVRVSNVTDSAFTVSWVTDEPMVGVVYYGEKDNFLPGPLTGIGKSKAVDDRDYSNAQMDCVSEFNKKASKKKDANFTVDIEGYDCNNVKVVKKGTYFTHHVTVQNLEAEKEYYFRVGDGYISYAKNSGTYTEGEIEGLDIFATRTKPVFTNISTPNSAYGTTETVYQTSDGYFTFNKNYDSVVFLMVKGSEGEEYPILSGVANTDGGWSIDLSNVRDGHGDTVNLDNAILVFMPQAENHKAFVFEEYEYSAVTFPIRLPGNTEKDVKKEVASAKSPLTTILQKAKAETVNGTVGCYSAGVFGRATFCGSCREKFIVSSQGQIIECGWIEAGNQSACGQLPVTCSTPSTPEPVDTTIIKAKCYSYSDGYCMVLFGGDELTLSNCQNVGGVHDENCAGLTIPSEPGVDSPNSTSTSQDPEEELETSEGDAPCYYKVLGKGDCIAEASSSVCKKKKDEGNYYKSIEECNIKCYKWEDNQCLPATWCVANDRYKNDPTCGGRTSGADYCVIWSGSRCNEHRNDKQKCFENSKKSSYYDTMEGCIAVHSNRVNCTLFCKDTGSCTARATTLNCENLAKQASSNCTYTEDPNNYCKPAEEFIEIGGAEGGNSQGRLKISPFKSYAQTSNSNEGEYAYYLPESGVYILDLLERGETKLIAEGKTTYYFYYNRNGEEGYQEPEDLSNVKADEDLLVEAEVAVISISKIAATKEIKLSQGINIVSFDFMPNSIDDPFTSPEFLKLANKNGDKVSHISYFSAGQWDGGTSYDFETKETKGVSFNLGFGKGYIIVAEEDTTVTIPGYNVQSPVPIAFSSGWNLVGIHGYDTQYTANSLINSINTIQGLKSNNVTYWPTSKGMYQGYQLSEGQAYGQDFSISKDLGYFVRISEFNASDDSCKSIIWNPGGDLNGKCGSSN